MKNVLICPKCKEKGEIIFDENNFRIMFDLINELTKSNEKITKSNERIWEAFKIQAELNKIFKKNLIK